MYQEMRTIKRNKLAKGFEPTKGDSNLLREIETINHKSEVSSIVSVVPLHTGRSIL